MSHSGGILLSGAGLKYLLKAPFVKVEAKYISIRPKMEWKEMIQSILSNMTHVVATSVIFSSNRIQRGISLSDCTLD